MTFPKTIFHSPLSLNRKFCQCPTCFTGSLPFTELTCVVWRCFSLGGVKADYFNSLWFNDRWPESFHFGSAWSLPQRRAGVLSSPAMAVFLGGAKNTTTQMEIVAPKCLLNSKEYILKKPIWVLRQKCRSICMISVFLFLFMAQLTRFLWILSALCWPRSSGKGKQSRPHYTLQKTIEYLYYIIIWNIINLIHILNIDYYWLIFQILLGQRKTVVSESRLMR